MRLAEAVRQYVVQGVPIPFALEAATSNGAGAPFKIVPLSHAHPSPHLHATDVATAAARDAAAGVNARKQRPGSAAVDRPKQPKASRNALRKMLDKLGLEGDNLARPLSASAYADSQKKFLDQVRLNPGNPSVIHNVYTATAPGTGPFLGFSPKGIYPNGAEGVQKGPSILSSELTSILQIVSSSDGSIRSKGSKGKRMDGMLIASNQTSGSLAAIRSIKSQEDEAISTLKEVQVGGGRNGSRSGSLSGTRK